MAPLRECCDIEDVLVRTQDLKPIDVLRRYFALKSIITDRPSTFERKQVLATRTEAHPAAEVFRPIGRGRSGTVFEIPGTRVAIKKKLCDSEVSTKSLVAEWELGIKTCLAAAESNECFQAFDETKDSVVPRVPFYREFVCVPSVVAEDGIWWQLNGAKFPKSHSQASSLLIFERIPPVPRIIRDSLIKSYFEIESQHKALLDLNNKDCLIRPYLGQRLADLEEAQKNNYPPDGLRNIPLYLDQLSELEQLNPQQLAQSMALGLASAHWDAMINMRGVEFVIGGLAEDGTPFDTVPDSKTAVLAETDRGGTKANQPITQMCMVDFDEAEKYQLESHRWEQSIAKLVRDTLANEPYYPHCLPSRKQDWELWLEFRDLYVTASTILIQKRLDDWIWRDACDEYSKKALQAPKDVMDKWWNRMVARMPKVEFNAWRARSKAENWPSVGSEQ